MCVSDDGVVLRGGLAVVGISTVRSWWCRMGCVPVVLQCFGVVVWCGWWSCQLGGGSLTAVVVMPLCCAYFGFMLLWMWCRSSGSKLVLPRSAVYYVAGDRYSWVPVVVL